MVVAPAQSVTNAGDGKQMPKQFLKLILIKK
jgi:hypothetical protein